ncbi:MAG: hypothetical protein ABSD98_05085 [Candidatus Korobacteraceae bacterium]
MRLFKWIEAFSLRFIIFSLVILSAGTLGNAQGLPQSSIIIEKKVLDEPIPPDKTVAPEGMTEFLIENHTRENVYVSISSGAFTYYGGGLSQACLVEKGLKSHPQYSTCDIPDIVMVMLPRMEYSIEAKTPFITYEGRIDLPALSPGQHYVLALNKVMGNGQAGGPLSGTIPQSSASSVESAIDKITQGAHQELPPPVQTQVSPGQNPGWSIENATAYQLHLYLSGPVERDYVIPQGSSIAIDLPPGSYRIAAEVSDKSVIPFYAVRQLNANARWSSHFYIAPR